MDPNPTINEFVAIRSLIEQRKKDLVAAGKEDDTGEIVFLLNGAAYVICDELGVDINRGSAPLGPRGRTELQYIHERLRVILEHE